MRYLSIIIVIGALVCSCNYSDPHLKGRYASKCGLLHESKEGQRCILNDPYFQIDLKNVPHPDFPGEYIYIAQTVDFEPEIGKCDYIIFERTLCDYFGDNIYFRNKDEFLDYMLLHNYVMIDMESTDSVAKFNFKLIEDDKTIKE